MFSEETPASLDSQEEAPSPSSRETSHQEVSHPSAEEPASPQTDEGHCRGFTPITMDHNGLTTVPTPEDALSTSPPSMTDVNTPHLSDLGHLTLTLIDPTEQRRDETVDTQCVLQPSTAVSAAAEDQEPSEQTESLDNTDVCVGQEI